MNHFTVEDIYYSLMMTGSHMGSPFIHLKFSGCSKTCGYCKPQKDTKFYTIEQLVEQVNQSGPNVNLCITGGEPLDQDINLLISFLKKMKNRFIILQTNGMDTKKLLRISKYINLIQISWKFSYNKFFTPIENLNVYSKLYTKLEILFVLSSLTILKEMYLVLELLRITTINYYITNDPDVIGYSRLIEALDKDNIIVTYSMDTLLHIVPYLSSCFQLNPTSGDTMYLLKEAMKCTQKQK